MAQVLPLEMDPLGARDATISESVPMYQPADCTPSCTSHGHTRDCGASIVTAIALGWERYNSGEDLKRDQPTSMNSFGSFRTSSALHEANKRKAPDATTRRGSNRNIFSKMEFCFSARFGRVEAGNRDRTGEAKLVTLLLNFDVFLFCGHWLVDIFWHWAVF